MTDLVEIAKRQLSLGTHKIFSLPIVILMPHSACNCRCVMCDIWKANKNKQEITREDLSPHLSAFQELNVRWVVLSGGEALMHANLWSLCELLKELDIRISLLSTGLLLKKYAQEVVRWCDEVIVSLDGSREVHDAIRRVPRAYDRLEGGVAALRDADTHYRVTARCVLQRQNFHDLPNIITAARQMELDQISFLAADVSTTAFNRPDPWDDQRAGDVALTPKEVREFTQIMEDTISRFDADLDSDFIAEPPDKLRRIVAYYAALNGNRDFPETVCNAPWVSTVIEANGEVRPCFFHPPLGHISEGPLDEILNSESAIRFRQGLNVKTDPICRKCVCSLYLGPRARVKP